MDWERRHTRRYKTHIYQHVHFVGVFRRGQAKRLNIDEFSWRKGHKDFVTTVCDIDSSELLEVIDSHKQQDIIEVLMQQSPIGERGCS